MTSFGKHIALKDKQSIIDDKLNQERDETIFKYLENIEEREIENEELIEVLDEYREYVRNIILEREMQLLAFNMILKYLDNIKTNNIERKQYQKDEDDYEERRIKKEKECIQKELDKLYKITKK